MLHLQLHPPWLQMDSFDTFLVEHSHSLLSPVSLFLLAVRNNLLTEEVYRHLGIGWATSVLGFLSLVMLPIPWVLYKWGPQIRAASKYETNKIPS
jgi:hypothetical protein